MGSISFADIAGLLFGDNSANRVAPIEIGSLGSATSFDAVVFHMGGSGAIDNVILETKGAAPEPSELMLLSLGLVGSATSRRLRR